MQNDDFRMEIEYEVAEAELALVKDEPLSAELRTYIKPSTLRRLGEYCREQKVARDRVVEGALAALLYDQ